MTQEFGLILALTGGLGAALLFGDLAKRLGLSPIVGYLIAGIAVGPHTPGLVADDTITRQVSEVGVVLLMFGVGLHFRLGDLLSVRGIALPGALIQVGLSAAAAALVSRLFGWGWEQGLIFGLALSIASTVVATRVLTDNKALHSPEGKISLGWLVVEDLLTVFALFLLPAIAVSGGGRPSALDLLASLGLVILKLAILFGLTLVVGKRLVPKALSYVSRTGSRELFSLTVLVLALGIGLGSSMLFGASMALGAFLAGMVVGQSDYSTRAASEVMPLRDAFAVLFFVSVGNAA